MSVEPGRPRKLDRGGTDRVLDAFLDQASDVDADLVLGDCRPARARRGCVCRLIFIDEDELSTVQVSRLREGEPRWLLGSSRQVPIFCQMTTVLPSCS